MDQWKPKVTQPQYWPATLRVSPFCQNLTWVPPRLALGETSTDERLYSHQQKKKNKGKRRARRRKSLTGWNRWPTNHSVQYWHVCQQEEFAVLYWQQLVTGWLTDWLTDCMGVVSCMLPWRTPLTQKPSEERRQNRWVQTVRMPRYHLLHWVTAVTTRTYLIQVAQDELTWFRGQITSSARGWSFRCAGWHPYGGWIVDGNNLKHWRDQSDCQISSTTTAAATTTTSSVDSWLGGRALASFCMYASSLHPRSCARWLWSTGEVCVLVPSADLKCDQIEWTLVPIRSTHTDYKVQRAVPARCWLACLLLGRASFGAAELLQARRTAL